jgi:DNA-binding LytR/AlgR family response regulator
MVRCHRSYIVNTSKIRFMSEEHRMHFVTFDDESIKRIPVSKSYYPTLLASLNTIGVGAKHSEPEAPTEVEEGA